MKKACDICDVNAEAAVVASVILNPDLVFYSEQLDPHYFTNEQNIYLYWAISELARRDGVTQIDAVNIINILEAKKATRGKTQTILTIPVINEFIENAPIIARTTPEDYKLVADAVISAAFRRNAYNKLVECQHLCFNASEREIEKKIYDALDGVIMEFSKTNSVPQYKDVVDDMWDEIKARQRGETGAVGFPFPVLNEFVVMEPGELVCFTGSAKSGKSAMLLTCTVDLLMQDKSVLYIDSEISTKLFTVRILAHLTKIPFAKIRSGNYTPEEEAEINRAVEWLKTRKFIHYYMPVFDENAVYLAAKKAKHTIGMDVIVVDYLKSTSTSSEAFSVYAEMGRFTDMIKNRICGDFPAIGLTAAQATASGKIADSARIARSVSTVVSIRDKTPEEIEIDGPECGNKKLNVVFNRNGAQMQDDEWIDMCFEGSTVTYYEAPMQHTIAEPY